MYIIRYSSTQISHLCSKACVCLYILSVSVGVTCTQLMYSLHVNMSIVICTLDEHLVTKPSDHFLDQGLSVNIAY